MKSLFLIISKIALGCVLLFAGRDAQAVILDWNSVGWSSGDLTTSYDIDASNSGNDITITITGNTSNFGQADGLDTPNDLDFNNEGLSGGLGNSEQSLYMEQDSWSTRFQSITVTMTFNYTGGVDNVNFLLFDVDNGADYTDKISNIIGIGAGGVVLAPTLTVSSGNELVGTGTNQYVRGTASVNSDSGDANVGINFGSQKVFSIQYTWGNEEPDADDDNPGLQWIGQHDVGWRKVPEFHPGLFATVGCVLLPGIQFALRRFRRSPQPSP